MHAYNKTYTGIGTGIEVYNEDHHRSKDGPHLK